MPNQQRLTILTRVRKCAGNAEDVFVISELPVARNINKFPFKLFVGVWEVTDQFFWGRGREVVVV